MIHVMSTLDLVEWNETLECLVRVFLKQQTDYRIQTQDVEWDNLSIEMAFFVRVYCMYCSEALDEDRIEALVPTLSAWVDLLDSYKALLAETEEERELLEYVLLQLLKCVQYLNLSDEMGRQRLLILLRKFLVETDIPSSNLNEIVLLMKKLAIDTDDFFRMIMEANCSIFDVVLEATDELVRATANLKVLDIIKHVFEHSMENFDTTSLIMDMIEQHVFPSVQSEKLAIKKLALECIALYALNDFVMTSHLAVWTRKS